MGLTRRDWLVTAAGGAVLAGSWAGRAMAQGKTLTILGHRSHQAAMEQGPSGNVAESVAAKQEIALEWLTFDTGPLGERLFREASLPATDIDVAFFLESWAGPNAFNLLEPLDSHLAASPIEDLDDFFPGPIGVVSRDGSVYGIPIRQNVAGLHVNTELLEERGLDGPPESIEQFLEYARQLTYRRDDGTPVVGFAMPNQASNLTHFARGWNADFITEDLRVTAAEPPMVTAMTALRDLFNEGAFPREFPTLLQEEAATWIQTGRSAMTITNMSRNPQLNREGQSRFPGRIAAVNLPISEALRDSFEIAPVGVSFWALVLPRNARDKALSWDFIREISSKENTRALALNGNGPMRRSLYADPDYVALVPYAEAELRALQVARVAIPPFENAARAADMIQEEAEAAILGFKEPQQAMDDLAARLEQIV